METGTLSGSLSRDKDGNNFVLTDQDGVKVHTKAKEKPSIALTHFHTE